MTDVNTVKLSYLLGNPTPKVILSEAKKIFSYHYPITSFSRIQKNYTLIKNLFEGTFPGYRACNTEYHNLSHTLDSFLAAVRIIDGYNINNAPFPSNFTINLLNAALLHDAGYIQEEWDLEGTGAKYTTTHIERSIQFLEKHHQIFQINTHDIQRMANLISCTGLNVRIDTIPFSSPNEKLAGCILGTADLIGQMSDRVYLEKLIFLYYEFKEAGIGGFHTEFDLIKKTADFYEMMKERLAESYMNVYTYAKYHFKTRFMIDYNLYTEAIERQIGYLHKIIADDTTNFRHKLKRGKWVHTYQQTRQ
jgi:hypothetical protein